VVALAVVVVVASVFAAAGIAGAAGLSSGAADSSGNYAECSVSYNEVPFSDSSWSGQFSLSGGWVASSLDSYLEGVQMSFYCNTAFGGDPYSVNIWQASSEDIVGFSGYLSADAFADGHVQGYFSGPITSYHDGIACLDPSVTSSSAWAALSSGDQAGYEGNLCGGAWTCVVQSGAYGSLPVPCQVQSAVSVTSASTTPPAEPGDYWVGESVSVPAPPVPLVECSVAVDQGHQTAELTGTTTTVAGVTDTYDWSYGDSSADGTALVETHSYSGDGPFTVQVTVTATGDGSTYSGTATGTCSKAVDFVSGSGGASGGGSTTPGAPTSCGITDFLCDIEAAVAWLVVPGPSFYSAWSGFLTALETKVPFSYVTETALGVYSFVSGMTTSSSASTCYSFNVGTGYECSSVGGTGGADMGYFRDALGVVFICATLFGCWGLARSVITKH
jgi:hypothetical protein